jgi:hypothetical protein
MVFIIVAVLTLASCATAKGDPEWAKLSKKAPSVDTEDIIADALFEAVYAAIQGKDSQALKSMFSKKALTEAKNIDEGIAYVFDLVQGVAVSWEQERIFPVDTFEYGKIKNKSDSWYVLVTTEETYIVFMSNYDIDEIDPDNQGLYALRVFRESDAATQEGNSLEMSIPGVYKPEK